MRHLRKIPLVGWLIGGIAALLTISWWLLRKLYIAQARIRVDSQLRKARDMNNRAALEILAGHRDKGRQLAIESQKRKEFYAKKRLEIQNKARDAEELSAAVNKAFNANR